MNLLKNLAKFGGGVAVSLVIFEIILGVFYPQERQTPLFDATDVFPLALRKNVDGWHRSAEFSVQYKTNAFRLRGPETTLEKPAGTKRILVLGDSLTFGSGVNDEDTFARQLETLLNARPAAARGGVTWEIINGACASWGTAHHLVLLDHLALKFDPDVVLMAFHDDDPKDNRISGFFSLEDGELVTHERSAPAVSTAKKILDKVPLYAWLSENSNLFSALRLRLAAFIKSRKAKAPKKTDILNTQPKAVWPEKDWKLTERLFVEMKTKVEAAGGRLALMHAPFPRFNREVEKRFIQLANRIDTPYLLLIDRVQGATEDAPNYFPVNRHFTPKGNRLIAEALLAFLDANGYLK